MKRFLFSRPDTSTTRLRQLSLRTPAGNLVLAGVRLVVPVILAVSFTALGERQALAQEIVRVYSSEGPEPAIREAGSAFATNEAVRIVGGPPADWINRAAADADVICSSADFMMADLIRNDALRIDPATVVPLYMRPSAILVRPGNPKRIEDFPDLLQPGVRVMVVTGSGQTGLWEDMASRAADVQTVRRLRENIVCYAVNSTEAVRNWRERKDVDAWITWDIWHMPLRTEAKLIPVSKDYRVYRQCSIALTSRGHEKPLAARFVSFLASPEGARIFASWGWMTPPATASPGELRHDITVVCGVDGNVTTNGVGLGLLRVKQLIEGYEPIGVPRHELHISVVLSGEAAHCLLMDGPYRTLTRREEGNPNKRVVEELLGCGVSVEVCGLSVKQNRWSKEDLLPGVTIVPGAFQRIVDLQLRGYAYLPF